MSDRFKDLKKIPQVPAARLLASTTLTLETPLKGPATAGVSEVLAELDEAGAVLDMLKLIAASLPPREAAWWACLAARDMLGPETEPTPSLKAAEAWVFRPSEQTRAAAFKAADAASPMDDTSICATIAVYADGSLGPDDLKELPAPDGAVAVMAMAMNIKAIEPLGGDFAETVNYLVDRALDIARGGNGRVERKARETA